MCISFFHSCQYNQHLQPQPLNSRVNEDIEMICFYIPEESEEAAKLISLASSSDKMLIISDPAVQNLEMRTGIYDNFPKNTFKKCLWLP